MTRTSTMEETPEQVLARLERYAASLRASGTQQLAPRPVAPPTPTPAPARAPAPAPVTTRWWEVSPPPPPVETSRELWRIALEAMGYVLGLICCVAAIFVFQRLGSGVASAIIAGLVIGGAIATARRLPLALWWTLGFAIGGLIARLS